MTAPTPRDAGTGEPIDLAPLVAVAAGRLRWVRDDCGCRDWFDDTGKHVGQSSCEGHALDAEEGWLAR